MRILLVVPGSHRGGFSRVAQRVRACTVGLVHAGHEVDVVSPRWWTQGGRTHHDRWVTHHAAGASALSPRRVAGLARRHDPDIVQLVDAPLSVAVATLLASGPPVIYEATGYDSPLVQSEHGLRVGGWVDRVIVPSEVLRTELRAVGLTTPVGVLPDPIEFDLIETVAPAARADIVWSGESLDGAYLDDLLLGLAEVDARELSTAVFLEADLPQAHEELELFGLTDRVEVIAGATRRERLAVYRGANVFVQTADACAFATELLWALASGCAGVVEYRVQSNAHEIIHAHPRGIRVVGLEDFVDGLSRGLGMAHRTIEPDFAGYDRPRVIDRLVEAYRETVNRAA